MELSWSERAPSTSQHRSQQSSAGGPFGAKWKDGRFKMSRVDWKVRYYHFKHSVPQQLLRLY